METQVLAALIKSKHPRIYDHLAAELERPPSELVAPWISTCYVGVLGGPSSFEATARIWDSLVFEGVKVNDMTDDVVT